MRHLRLLSTILLITSGLLLAGCDANEADVPTQGQMQVYLTDAPTDSLASAFVTIERLELIGADESTDEGDTTAAGDDTVILLDEPVTLDLLALRDTSARELLADVVIPSDDYDQLRLIVSGDDNYVVPESDLDAEIPLKTPSGQQSGIKIQLPDFNLDDEGDLVVALLDFDAAASIHRAGQSGQYVLRPTIDLTDFEVDGQDIDVDDGDDIDDLEE